MLNKTQKLIAIETYLQWDITDKEVAIEVLDHIWWVVYEGRLKPEPEEVGNEPV